MRVEQSNSLAVLAGRIKAEHEAVHAALKDSVQHAIDAGDLLIEAKQQLGKHGQWLKWLSEHCGVTERTAQRYMRLARHKAKYDTVSDLTLNGALALLTAPRETLDDSLLQSYVDNLDGREEITKALRSQAEIARRRVVLEQVQRNLAAVEKIHERLGIDPDYPVDQETKDLVANIYGAPEDFGALYRAAVDSDDHDHAFALAEWLHGFTVSMLRMAKDIERHVATHGLTPPLLSHETPSEIAH
jgi:hypothetical protein